MLKRYKKKEMSEGCLDDVAAIRYLVGDIRQLLHRKEKVDGPRIVVVYFIDERETALYLLSQGIGIYIAICANIT